MKKLSLVLVAICAVALFSSSAFAIDAGKWRVGGGATGNYMSLDPEGGGTLSFTTIGGEVGYLVIPNLEVGLGVSYINADISSYAGSGGPSSISVTVLHPYGKYYFPMGDNALFVGAGYNTSTFDIGSSQDVSGFTGLVGYSIRLNAATSVDISATYDMLSADNGGGDLKVMEIGASVSVWL
jgi:hypothetical protein